MELWQIILDAYPELTINDFNPVNGIIGLQDDGDGIAYIAKWDYDQPIPAGLKLGK
jgi:uncharacterized protein (UPF0297 family)